MRNPVWPRLVRPTNLMSRMNGKETHTHTHTAICTQQLQYTVQLTVIYYSTVGYFEYGVFKNRCCTGWRLMMLCRYSTHHLASSDTTMRQLCRSKSTWVGLCVVWSPQSIMCLDSTVQLTLILLQQYCRLPWIRYFQKPHCCTGWRLTTMCRCSTHHLASNDTKMRQLYRI